jgi:HEAT repeat protein
MNVLTEEASQTVRRFLMGLLQQFKDRTIPEATRRLGDQRWFVKRNMLYILGECNSKEVLPYVRPYCRHEDLRVGVEATKCLLKLGDSYGVSAVRDYLNSDSREVIEMAVSLAGSFRIKELVPELIRMLGKRSISGADIYAKIPLVKALGDIGDPRALGILKSLISRKNILFKGAADKLKEEIYRTLRNYPYNDIQDLLRAGMKSRSEVIRQEAMRLTREEDR